MTRITGVRCIRTRHDGSWVIVKVLTDQDGLYGIGSASDVYQPGAVVSILEELLTPLLIGRDVSQIEDIWQTMYTSGYWRNGSTLHTAMSGIDMALWDIKGKEAGMPVYQLLGGAVRSAVPCYAHANGHTYEELEEEVATFQEQGFGVIRCQLGGYGGGGFVPARDDSRFPPANRFDEASYITAIPDMFEKLRVRFGMNLAFTHDVHEHLTPSGAVTLSRLLDPYRLFFLEDLLQAEHTDWYRRVKETSTTPQAVGELFVHPQEWLPLVQGRLIDFVRMRVSKAGGITPCRKIAAVCEAFGVRTAWQEGGENDPVNQLAAVHLDMAIMSFGVQEINHFRAPEQEAFPGLAELVAGHLHVNDKPGLGIDIDEVKAAALLRDPEGLKSYHNPYKLDRKPDGTLIRP
ncbi:D-galactonate dehydratase family protein [Paenibacillus sp. JCM 10914]|uniref:enolase C-terminal domain-like protein n=1 Tax=Paenibacillus sp. JCM 10914 TaxID=1236974 RepID=UPI0003CCB718|nr:enolase C-terminal domain-like protein [Paenibacillus sp. JCM 10914]GAE05502.1 starvation sensing protein RspA [Paenibacillus sp. JCM 10914]